MSDLVHDSMTKPKLDNMSMDEILASIRKIIASDQDDVIDGNTHKKSDLVADDTESKQDNYIHKEPHSAKLSAREQLANLTKSAHEKDEISYSKRPVYQKISQEVYDKLDNIEQSDQNASDDEDNLHYDHDDDILRALNEIRQSLVQGQAHGKGQAHSNQKPHKNIRPNEENDLSDPLENIQTNPLDEESELYQNKPKISTLDTDNKKEEINKIEKENSISDIDLKPVQFSSDEVPNFLKNFKNQQTSEKTQNMKRQGSVNYDFSAIPKFDEPSEVITLTEKVMPTQSSNLDMHDEKTLNNSQIPEKEHQSDKSVSKLRNGAEEIMRRATERTLMDAKGLHDTDAPLSALIVRTLKPMLQEWIDKNMQEIAEEVLRDEFRRGLT